MPKPEGRPLRSGFLFKFLRTIKIAVFILTGEQAPHKWEVFFTYLKLKTGALWYRVFRRPDSPRVNILGFQVESFTYAALMFLFEEIFAGGEYYFSSRSPSPLILDLGCNVGMALLFFKWLYPKARSLAFEADDVAFRLLTKNVESNHLRDVQLHNRAVGDAAGAIQLHYDYESNDLRVSMSIRDRPGLKALKSVSSVQLSEYIQEEVDFLKMDIEGAEGLVIHELARSGKLNYIREMVMEYHHHLTPTDDALSAILATLEQNHFGYQVTTLGREGPFRRGAFQSLLIHAYRKSTHGSGDKRL